MRLGILFLALLGFSCTTSTEKKSPDAVEAIKNEEAVKPSGEVVLDLTNYGFEVLLTTPDTSNKDIQISETKNGTLVVNINSLFNVTLGYDGDLAMFKADLEAGSDVFEYEIVSETPTEILYKTVLKSESKLESYHFYTVMDLGGEFFEFFDTPSDKSKSEKSVRKMLSYCKKSTSSLVNS